MAPNLPTVSSNWIAVCAESPYTTIFVCIGLICILSGGIYFLEITTDPVELWAAPHSRSRLEKDYFDRTFGPFYRTTQIFIRPTKIEYVSKLFRIWDCPWLRYNECVLSRLIIQPPLVQYALAPATTWISWKKHSDSSSKFITLGKMNQLAWKKYALRQWPMRVNSRHWASALCNRYSGFFAMIWPNWFMNLRMNKGIPRIISTKSINAYRE